MADVAFASQAFAWFQTWIFWGLVLLGMAAGLFGGLWARKKRKLKYPSAELVPLGNGGLGLVISTCGFFKGKKTLFGMLDYGGEEQLQLKDGRKILNASSENFIEINGKRGPLILRKGDDPEILMQISDLQIGNKSRSIMAEIAPGDYRDAASQLIESADRETMKKWEKVLPYVAIGVIVLFAIIVIIVAIQFANNSLDKADAILKRAEATNAQIPEAIGREVGNAIAKALNQGATPPPSSSAP